MALGCSSETPAPLCPRTNVLGVVGSLWLGRDETPFHLGLPVSPAHYWLTQSHLLPHPGQLTASACQCQGETELDIRSSLPGEGTKSGERGLCPLGGCGLAMGLDLSPGPLLPLPPLRRPHSQVIPECLEGPLLQGRKSKGSGLPAHTHVLSRSHPAGSARLGVHGKSGSCPP